LETTPSANGERTPRAGGALFSIGYGGRTLDGFASLLREHGIGFVADVRFRPWSRHWPDFGQDRLRESLAGLGFRYLWLGKHLGGTTDDPALLLPDGRLDIEAAIATEGFRGGIARLIDARAKGFRVCLMGPTKRPEACHRTTALGEALAREGVPLEHIDERGRLIGQAQAMARLAGNGQGDLFA
jgi:uncharacterized protein (DUF488 family)